ncbi:MAG: S41 family peptidase [Muribaculaceae bacterium]|nr:S41 family peptidase [Muribaculaceae bacterium]
MKKLIVSLIAITSAFYMMALTFSPNQKLRYAEGIIESYYVDTVDTNKIVDEAIIAMLKTLDPHSSYSSPEETKELTEPLEGNFSGIGIQFNMLNDTLYVIETISGGPSERVGIRAGDRIIMANDTIIAGVKMKNNDIIKKLRGPKGSIVNVSVVRRGEAQPIEFSITRDNIPLFSVDAAYMATPTIGYIRIARFAKDTFQEVAEAMDKLSDQGMKDLIIDVENNGGGYMGTAIEISSLFLNNNELIVYTQGDKSPYHEFRTLPIKNKFSGKVVIMANQYSASASEILAGAMQDNDRGLVVGRRTFGKGLVQRPFPFPDGSMIRLTVSRYYTPSGRSIQRPYEKGESEDYYDDMRRRYDSGEFSSADSIHFADSLMHTTLRNHRKVYGGGGIMPDLFVPIDTAFYSDYYRDLVAKGAINQHAIDYVDKNRKQLLKEYKSETAFINNFIVDDDLMNSLVQQGEKLGVKYNEEQFLTSKEYIRTIIKALLARDLFLSSSYYRVANSLNPTYHEAIKLINDNNRYNTLLGN